jgi:hypothetical protein
MKRHNVYRAALGVFALGGILIGVIIVGVSNASLGATDPFSGENNPGEALVWLSLGGTLFNFAMLAGIAWLAVSALTLYADQRDEKAAAIITTPTDTPEAATP